MITGIDSYENSEAPSWSPDGRYLAFYHIGKSSSGETEYASSIQLIDIETLERYWLVQEARLSQGIRNPEWVPGEGYIISWEFERGVDTPNRELHTYDIRWESGVPTLRQLPIVLNELQGPVVWTLNGEFALFMAFNNSKELMDDAEVYEIATLPINLASYLHTEDVQPTTISLTSYWREDRIQFLTDNYFLDHLPAWTP